MPEDFQEFAPRLTDNARVSLQHAEAIARSSGSAYIGTEHVLLGVLAQGSSVAAKFLADIGITLDRAELALNLTPRSLVVSTGSKGLSETAKLTLRMSWELAKEFQQDYLGTEHILYSILVQKNARATVLLKDMSVDIDELKGDIEQFFDRQRSEIEADMQEPSTQRRKRSGVLAAFSVDLTEKARAQQLDPVIGRDEQIERIISVLSRRTKNNPVLLGDPGVGKTAVVEGLAQRIVAEDVPDHLLDVRLLELDLTAMIAGTKYRGEFEERLKKVIDEVQQSPHTVLFIDEIHSLMGAGAAEGALDAANILKPALARGEIRVIGATTQDEYRKSIEKDAALERRFQVVRVPEPSKELTVRIIKGLRLHYEDYHRVTFDDEAIELAVHLADKYIADRFMPDKALDVIDEAAALLRVKSGRRPSRERDLKKQLLHLEAKMNEAVTAEDYERAALYKMRMSRLQEKLDEATHTNKQPVPLTLDEPAIARAITIMTGIPLDRIKKDEARQLLRLEKTLASHIIGQEEAVAQVAKALRRNRSGVSDEKRPIGSFIFMGPTGVGKTQLAKVLAREVFGDENSLIKIDMSEFSEKHTAARLVGAPAGYVGYEDGGKLTEAVRRKPYSVLLFDEVEKAHRDIFNILLQILEDGTLTDAKGRTVKFNNTIIILTSNLGAERMQKEASLGFEASTRDEKQAVEALHVQNARHAREALEKMMRPELINRFDSVVTFHSLSRRQVSRVLTILLNELQSRLARQGVRLVLTPGARKVLITRGYDRKYGARHMRQVLQDSLEHLVAEALLSGTLETGTVATISAKKGELQLHETRE
ncbi:ATP-dependent Clp protease ATP-binding subunit [Candidatus Saccharibacteria bacterium]|nr:ATP-dependent Clp protease ATP-binding subunit [Candidatus Saccharibacteria bacterium]